MPDPDEFFGQYLADLETLTGLTPVETDDDEAEYGQGDEVPS